MVTKEEIKHIAKLARIEISEKEEEKFQKELSGILDYVAKLNEVNTDHVEPLYQTTGLINAMRPDEHRGDFVMDEKLNELLLGQAPDKQNRFIKVKAALKK